MGKYSKAVSELYSRFERRKAYPMEKYVGRLVNFYGERLKVVGYRRNDLTGDPLLIVEALPFGGWSVLEPSDVIFKECKGYWYADIKDLID